MDHVEHTADPPGARRGDLLVAREGVRGKVELADLLLERHAGK